MEKKNNIEVCFTPVLFPLYKSSSAVVVVIDVLRATSAIVTAFEYGVSEVIPVSTVEEAREYQQRGFLAAAERDGSVVEGFEFGNSPFSYMLPSVKEKQVVVTTTNGTKAMHAAKDAEAVIIGSFLNLDAVVNYLAEKDTDVILLCSGWKDRFNMEDTLFAGAVTKHLLEKDSFSTNCDSARAAVTLYNSAREDLYKFLGNSSHRERLAKLDLEKDIRYCLQLNTIDLVPVYSKGSIKRA